MSFFLFTLACLLMSFLFSLCLGSHVGETLWVWLLMLLGDPISQMGLTPGPLAPPQRCQIERQFQVQLSSSFVYLCEMGCDLFIL